MWLLVARGLQPLEHLLLAFVVSGDGEGHELVERHAVLGIDVEQRRRHRSEPQALFHDRDRDEEGGRDLLLGLTLLAQRQEGPELVERVERRALDVLGERILLGDAALAHDAGDRRGLRQALLLHQQFERPVAAAAGRDLEYAGLIAIGVAHRPNGEALQERAPGDILGQLLDRNAGLDAADIRLGQDELVEGNVARGAEGELLNGGRHG